MVQSNYPEEAKLYYLMDVIRDVKLQQPDKSLIQIIYDAMAKQDMDIIFIWESDEILCKLLSDYHDKIYQQKQEKLKSGDSNVTGI